jgi:hypothetical protein
MLVYAPFALCFVTLCGVFLHFPELTYWRDAIVPVHCFLLFLCFKKVTQEIFSELDETKAEVPIFSTRDGVQSRDGGGPEGSRTMGWHDLPLARATRWWGHLAHLLPSVFHLYILLDEKTLSPPINFPENILQATTVIDARLGGSRSSSRHPAREGNHHRRPSSSPCLPPEWCVSSLPWTTGL